MKKIKNVISIILLLTVFIMAVGCGNDGKQNDTAAVNESGKGSDEQQNEDTENRGASKQEEPDSYQELSEGDTAPDFTAQTADGKTFTLSEQNGKVVLLNFWATWCGPCVGEMPAFEKLYGEYKEEVAILAVNCVEDKDTVDQFISDNGYTFPIAYDVDGAVNMKYPTAGIPYTLVIDQDGIVKNIYLGADGAEKQYEEYKSAIDALLGK